MSQPYSVPETMSWQLQMVTASQSSLWSNQKPPATHAVLLVHWVFLEFLECKQINIVHILVKGRKQCCEWIHGCNVFQRIVLSSVRLLHFQPCHHPQGFQWWVYSLCCDWHTHWYVPSSNPDVVDDVWWDWRILRLILQTVYCARALVRLYLYIPILSTSA